MLFAKILTVLFIIIVNLTIDDWGLFHPRRKLLLSSLNWKV